MTKTANRLAALVFLLLSATCPAVAQSLPQPQTQGDVTFVSGGVGDDSQQAMLAAKPDYNLHLLFAQAVSGGFFANLPVRIVDASGAVVVNATSMGPFFYARLKPGTYTVSAAHRGVPMTKTATIPETGAIDLNFYWEY
jgi:hypothetical protein